MTDRIVKLHGRIFLRADIELLTGLHIGGAAGGLEIGGVDKPVIRNARTNQPYIPGSSLKGKLRSQMEKAHGAPQNHGINTVYIHMASSEVEFNTFPISNVFGTLPEKNGFFTKTPTRLTVRDVHLTEKSAAELKNLRTDLPFTEIKWEAAIDRVTSAATPRQIERVPAGAVFGPAEFIFSVYTGADEQSAPVAELFDSVVEALNLLQDDYLGGMGSRGSGQVRLRNISVFAKRIREHGYGDSQDFQDQPLQGLADLDRTVLKAWLAETFA